MAGADKGKLGTFAGVFTPSILTILGIILFLRLDYVVGNAGLVRALAIVALANLISILTSFSVAAIATNLRVKAGGDYYLISRTLGVEFGGSIGLVLFLAQSISVGFYCIGFAEALASILPATSFPLIKAAAASAILFLFVLAWLGADWASRFQFVVMGLIAIALVSFFAGGFIDWNFGQLKRNLTPAGEFPFWILFAVYFPAVTGFTQGISMSGDLRDPGKALPNGTFAALALSVFVYFAAAVIFAGALPNEQLGNKYPSMKTVSVYSPLIDAGVISATLSSALASFLGAPRILQALSEDRIFPRLQIFAKGSGRKNNPRRAVMLTALIALAVVALGELNVIAAIVSMFFLISYGLLNYATYFEARTESPAFRPTFKYYHRAISLAGSVTCLGAMLAIDIIAGVAAAIILFAIYQYLKFRDVVTRWADSQRSYNLQRVRENLIAAAAQAEHPRDWRPQSLVFSESRERRHRLLCFAHWIEGGAGVTSVVQIVDSSKPDVVSRRKEAIDALWDEIENEEFTVFPLVVSAAHPDEAVSTIIQAAGIGPLHKNIALANWLGSDADLFGTERESQFSENLATAFALGCNVVVFDAREDEWKDLESTGAEDRVIDIWWTDTPTGHLSQILAHLMTRDEEWSGAAIRIMVERDPDLDADTQRENVDEMLKEVRLEAEPVLVDAFDTETVLDQSRESSIVFVPFRIKRRQLVLPFTDQPSGILDELPLVAMVLAARDIDLGADPEEGEQAEKAATHHTMAVARKRLEECRGDVQAAEERAEKLQKELKDLRDGGASPDKIEDKRRELNLAQRKAREAIRRTERATSLLDMAEQRAGELGLDLAEDENEPTNEEKKD